MKTASSNAPSRAIWVGAMAGASTLASLLLACATPFPSLAALAATKVSRRDGFIVMAVAWFAAQVVTFTAHGYDAPTSMTWPFALATAAAASLLLAGWTNRALGHAPALARAGGAYLAAFVGFKLGVLVWVNLLGHGWSAFSADVLLRQFVRYGANYAAMAALQHLLERIGLQLGDAAAPRPAHAA